MYPQAIFYEYQTLREEMLNKIQYQYDIVKYTLIMVISIFTVMVQFKNFSLVIGVFLTLIVMRLISWYYHEMSIKISYYIQEHIEKNISELNWETKSHLKEFNKIRISDIGKLYNSFIAISTTFYIYTLEYQDIKIDIENYIRTCIIFTIIIVIMDCFIFFKKRILRFYQQTWEKYSKNNTIATP